MSIKLFSGGLRKRGILKKDKKNYPLISIDMVVLNNSLSIDVKKLFNISNFSNKYGGLSGDQLFPYTEKLVESVHNKFSKLPIIACGGITNGKKVWSLLNKGESLFDIYSGMTFKGLNLVIDFIKFNCNYKFIC